MTRRANLAVETAFGVGVVKLDRLVIGHYELELP
jgi:hypothetical protein